MGDLTALSQFISELTWEKIPEEVREGVLLHVMDTVASGLGARREAQIDSVVRGFEEMEPGSGASLWGRKGKASPGTAAFLNAMMSHTLELDDVHVRSKCHIGTVVVPAAWAAAESLGRSGREFLTAVVCGYEAMSRVGMAFGVSEHRNLGWHATATAGTFGAAAAAASLMKLDPRQTEYALGLAGAQSFGTWAFLGDGASCKVLNPARAAQSGLEGALLARQQMSGPAHILTAADGGLLHMMSTAGNPALAEENLGTVWETLRVDAKPYPSCRSTHSIIDGVLYLKNAYGLDPEQVEEIQVETYLVGVKQCALTQASLDPKSAPSAKFSTPYVVACALLFGDVSVGHFRQEVLDSPKVRAFLPRVHVRDSDEFTSVYPEHWGSRVSIRTADGRVCSVTTPDASGSVDNPLSREQMERKARGLLQAGRLPDPQAVIDQIHGLAWAEAMPVL